MNTITINVLKKSVMGVVEGLSATIAQHNPEADFESLWASDSEESKLDIYFREAVTDLESHISKWTSSTSTQFDLQALADDLCLTIKVLAYWPPRLSGLLTNQIQNYLVHAIIAGWLNDFPDIKATDYASMGATDLDCIKEILLKKEFAFAESNRAIDTEDKEGKGYVIKQGRIIDTTDKEASGNQTTRCYIKDSDSKDASHTGTSGRSGESQIKEIDTLELTARNTESGSKKQNGANVIRRNEEECGKQSLSSRVSKRFSENENKNNNDKDTTRRRDDAEDKKLSGKSSVSARHKDDEKQCLCHEHVDWSGGISPIILR